MTPETKTCQNCKNQFTIESEDFEFYKKIDVPPPTWCPECRMQRRFMWRNEWRLFKKKEADSGEEVFSVFPDHSPNKIYKKEKWWSDSWEPMSYGREYDFSQPFFRQFQELIQTVPFPSRALAGEIVNSDYSMNAGWLKNCYMVCNADYVENSAYLTTATQTKNSFDCSLIQKSELCYDCYNITRCHKTISSVNCEDCTEVLFSKDCVGCASCFGCVGLRNKSYCIFNKQYSKEEYAEELKKMSLDTASGSDRARDQAEKFWKQFPVKYLEGWHNEGVTGEYIQNSKNALECYRVNEGENLKFCQMILYGPAKDSYDQTTWGANTELIYESGQCGEGAQRVRFSFGIYSNVRDIQYSLYCHNSSNLFGCIALRNKQYCILNKQYSKEEYEILIPKIIEQMKNNPFIDSKGRVFRYGEFFPPDLSPFAYNETINQDYFPLTEETAIENGYRWHESEKKSRQGTLKSKDLPDSIQQSNESLLELIVECAHEGGCNHSCSLVYRFIPDEMSFHKESSIPLPRLCPNCRSSDRWRHRNFFAKWRRQCDCAGEWSKNDVYQNTTKHLHGDGQCLEEFQTSHSGIEEIVYCKDCYQREVV